MRRSTAEQTAIEARRAQVADLFVQGVRRQEELARRLGVDRSTISRDLKAVREAWREAARGDYEDWMAEELALLADVQREYRTAWEASKQAKETTTSEQTTVGDGERARASIRKEEQHGDPRFLAGVLQCSDRRRQLRGLDAPPKAPVALPAWKAYAGFDPDDV